MKNISGQQQYVARELSSNVAAIEAWTVVIQQIVASTAHISTIAQLAIILAQDRTIEVVIRAVNIRKPVNHRNKYHEDPLLLHLSTR